MELRMRIVLTPEELAELFKQAPETRKNGGFQSLLVGLQMKVNRSTGTLWLDAQDLERIPRYAFDYGRGGWENRLLRIFGRSLGPTLGRRMAA
jgi:predicted GNAT superfamily acetyltransferase